MTTLDHSRIYLEHSTVDVWLLADRDAWFTVIGVDVTEIEARDAAETWDVFGSAGWKVGDPIANRHTDEDAARLAFAADARLFQEVG